MCQINPGEPLGIFTLIQPRVFASTAHSCGPSRVIQFDAQALATLFEEDPELELALMRRMAEAAISRLNATRIQLAAAWSQQAARLELAGPDEGLFPHVWVCG